MVNTQYIINSFFYETNTHQAIKAASVACVILCGIRTELLSISQRILLRVFNFLLQVSMASCNHFRTYDPAHAKIYNISDTVEIVCFFYPCGLFLAILVMS